MVENEEQKVARIRREIENGTYFTKEKFAIAVSNMLEEIRESHDPLS